MHLYQQHLLDHYKHPRNRGTLDNPTFTSSKDNPLCGDSIIMQGRIIDGVLTEVAFQGEGCVISQAAASMLTELCRGKKIADILMIGASIMRELVKIELGPTRLKCALLPLEAVHAGIKESDAQSGQTDQTGAAGR